MRSGAIRSSSAAMDGEIDSMADDALSNLRWVESQMEQDEEDTRIANEYERRARA